VATGQLLRRRLMIHDRAASQYARSDRLASARGQADSAIVS
jgi:hypothetical protein